MTKDVTMMNDAVRAVIDSDALAHLVTTNRDGSPHVSLAWTGLEDDEIVIGTLFDQRKLANVRREPRVAVSYQTDVTNDHGLREHLIIEGRARITEGGAADLLQRLAHIYLGPAVRFPPMPDPPAGFITRIAVERIRGVGPWT